MAIEEDLYWEDEEFNKDISSCVSEINIDTTIDNIFTCNHCQKTCKSNRGLTRHINCKHSSLSEVNQSKRNKFKRILDEEKFGELLLNSLAKMKLDECLPDNILDEYQQHKFSSEDIALAYHMVI